MFLADPPDNPDNHASLDPIPFPDQDEGQPQFPVFILAAPGLLCLLALALPRALASAMKTPLALWSATFVAAAGAIGSFWIVTALAKEREVRIPGAVALIGSILLTLRAVIMMI